MKTLLTSIAMVLLLALPAQAQDNKRPRFNPEEFKARMETYIAQKAELSPAESEKVFPIYHEMKAKQRDLMQQEYKLKRNSIGDSEKAHQEALLKIVKLHKEAADIEETYYKKMFKAISAKKVYAIMRAEDAFHREMLQRANNNNPRPRPKRQ